MASGVQGILGKKIGMSEAYGASGERVPVTLLQAGPCVITQLKAAAGRDGYAAAQLGLVEFTKPGRLTQPQLKRLEKHDLPPVRFLREVPVAAAADGVAVGGRVLAEMFQERDWVDVVGVSKGRGFAGVVKRHHFGGGAASHGSMFHRAPGSIGASAFPSRVLKGMRAAGHMGHARVTTRNLQIVAVDADDNLLAVRGAVPGPNGGYLIIRRAVNPPRVRRGFAGSTTVDPLKASKKRAGK